MGRLKQDQQAFTIIETILFLAISGLLILIAINAISGRNATVRFNQAMRSVEAFVQLQQNNVQNGVVPDSDTTICNDTSSSNQCVALGRAIEFLPESSEIIVHTITGNRLIGAGLLASEEAITLTDALPFTDGLGASDPDNKLRNRIDWQAQFVSGKMTLDGVTVDLSPENRMIGFLRLPNGTEITPIGFSSPTGINDAESHLNALRTLNDSCFYQSQVTCSPGLGASTAGTAFEAQLCFVSPDGGQFAELNLGGDERRQAINMNFLGRGQRCDV